jgi:hypothetical protein
LSTLPPASVVVAGAVVGGVSVVVFGGWEGCVVTVVDRSSTLAPSCSFVGVDEHPASRTTTAHNVIHRFIALLLKLITP